MATRRTALIPLLLVAPFALAACTFSASANATVGADQVATLAEDALEDEVGSRPDIDCGDDQVDLVDGTVVDCELTDPASGTEYDAPVTISNVDGTEFTVDVQVAETPND